MLIAAFNGEPEFRDCALALLSEPNIEFWYSPLLKLEVVLQPAHRGHTLELQFYNTYFKNAQCWGDLNRILEIGEKEAIRHGISVLDALHLAAANLSRCKVFVTTEKISKPIFKTKLVKVVSIIGTRFSPLQKLLAAP